MVQNAVRSSAVAMASKGMPPSTSVATWATGAPTCPGVTPATNISTNSEATAVRQRSFGQSTRPSTNMRVPPQTPSCKADATASTSQSGCSVERPSARSARFSAIARYTITANVTRVIATMSWMPRTSAARFTPQA